MSIKNELNTSIPTLLFIPDISGFTDFVSNTESSHSQHIIQELLEVIIDANEIGLEVSEIEGDAVLFYRQGSADITELLAQIQRMYTEFHGHLMKYHTQRICHCGACVSTDVLKLKFFVHYGDVAIKEVKNFQKLFGKDVIVAHRLMKNEIPHKEYALFSQDLINACTATDMLKQTAWSAPVEGSGTYDFGTIEYSYLTLEELSKHIPPPVPENFISDKAEQVYDKFERVIASPLETVFSVLTDLNFRGEWIPFLKGIDDVNHKIPQQGSSHRCVIDGGDGDLFFVSHNFDIKKDLITFMETEPHHKVNVLYTLRRIGHNLTRLERINYSKNGLLNKIKYMMKAKKGMVAWVNGALDNFKVYCEKLAKEGQPHTSEIVLPSN